MKAKKVNDGMEVLKHMCATCQFRQGSPNAYLVPTLISTMLTTSRICHNTGSNNAINRRTGRPPALCRGARDWQLNYFHQIKFIEAPHDEAWEAKWKELHP